MPGSVEVSGGAGGAEVVVAGGGIFHGRSGGHEGGLYGVYRRVG